MKSKLIGNLKKYPYLFWVYLFIPLIVLTIIIDICFGFDLQGFWTEWHGFLLDVIIFGIFFTYYLHWRESAETERRLLQELDEYMNVATDDAIVKKQQIVRHLNELSATLPELQGIFLRNARLEKLNFDNSNLPLADLRNSYIRNSSFIGANLNNALMANASILDSNFQKSNLHNATLASSRITNVNLSDSDISSSYLSGTYFYKCNLERANLRRARLEGASFEHCKLDKCSFEGANLVGTTFKDVEGLTMRQLSNVITDESTVLPNDLQ